MRRRGATAGPPPPPPIREIPLTEPLGAPSRICKMILGESYGGRRWPHGACGSNPETSPSHRLGTNPLFRRARCHAIGKRRKKTSRRDGSPFPYGKSLQGRLSALLAAVSGRFQRKPVDSGHLEGNGWPSQWESSGMAPACCLLAVDLVRSSFVSWL